ncbi:unnamed protein product, partial [marine sediment metagenome]
GSLHNTLISRKYKGIYDSQIAGSPLFQWNLGESSGSEGILLFGSESFSDSTINVDISSISLDVNGEVDVERILIYGSDNGVEYNLIGRAFYSNVDLWSFYWDYDLSGEDPVDYYLKSYIFDKSDNHLIISYDVKLYDFDLVVLLTDLVFGDIIDYDPTLDINEFDITGSFYLQNTDINLWDLVASYYDPLACDWIPLYTQPATVQSAGSYADYVITWDINQDKDFMDLMYNFTYEFLPMRITSESSSDIWGSWGIFDASGEWKPILLLDVSSQIDVVIYKFDAINGWIVDTTLSNENAINTVPNQVFRIFDINGDGIFEIIRVSSSQVDVIHLDQNSDWSIKTDCINNPDLQYSLLFDLYYNEVISETTIVIFQDNTVSGKLELGKYYFDSAILIEEGTILE